MRVWIQCRYFVYIMSLKLVQNETLGGFLTQNRASDAAFFRLYGLKIRLIVLFLKIRYA